MRRINSASVEIAVRDEGDGPAVLLLHGFPDSSALWRHQVPALTGAGFRAVAPDLRGFGASGRPEALEDYGLAGSVRDLVAVLDALRIERAHVVGHDWGAGVAWAFAAFIPDRVERLVAMSVGHPALRAQRPVAAREKAWYQLAFQFDEAEELFSRDDWKLMREWMASHPELDERIAALSQPGAFTAGLNWYRANLHPRREFDARVVPPVSADTLGIWSTGDAFLLEEQMVRSQELVLGTWRYERIEGASHWMQLDAPDRVNELLLGFLS